MSIGLPYRVLLLIAKVHVEGQIKGTFNQNMNSVFVSGNFKILGRRGPRWVKILIKSQKFMCHFLKTHFSCVCSVGQKSSSSSSLQPFSWSTSISFSNRLILDYLCLVFLSHPFYLCVVSSFLYFV